MKLTYKSPDGRFQTEFDADEEKALFKKVADFQEVFEEGCCGACKCEVTKLVVRTVDDNLFYERHCTNPDCKCVLSYGVHKKGGTLFPKRVDESKKQLPDNGWKKPWTK